MYEMDGRDIGNHTETHTNHTHLLMYFGGGDGGGVCVRWG